MDQVTTNLIQSAITNNVYDSGIQSLQLKLTASDYVRTAYSDTLGLWVSVGANGIVATSRNNTDWNFSCITTNQLYDVKFANGLFVTVGASSTVFISTNGYDWIQRSFPVASLTLTEVVYANNTWVISSYTGSQRIFSSTDGINWSPIWNTTAQLYTDRYTTTYYANNTWVTILGGQPATSSNNGVTWVSRPINFSNNYTMLFYTGSSWFISTAGTNARMATSIDGINWTPIPDLLTYSNFFSPIVIGNNSSNIILGSTGGNCWVSTDNGRNWVYVSASGTYTGFVQGLAYGNSRWVMVSQNEAAISTNSGFTWTQTVASGLGQSSSGLAYLNNLFVIGTTTGVIKTSTDGTTWTTRISNTTQPIYDIKYFNNLFISVGGSGNIRNGGTDTTGPGGIGWTTITSNTTNQLNKVSYGFVNGTTHTWVAVGNNGTIVSSTDNAATWAVRTSGVSTTLVNVEFQNGIWMVYGTPGVVLTSTDGITWTTQKRDLQQPRSIAFSNGIWTAVGNSGEIVTSTDLNNWTFRTSGTTNQLNHVVYKNNLWCAVGNSGTLVTSTDASTWTFRNLSATSNSNFNQIDYGNAVWAACGSSGAIIRSINNTTNANIATWATATSGVSAPLFGIVYNSGSSWTVSGSWGYILKSTTDASTWSSSTSLGTLTHPVNALNSVAFGTGVFVAVGASGTIISSTDGLNWAPRTSSTTNQLRKVIFANGYFIAVGDSGTIRTSTDGTSWASNASGTTNQLLDVGFGNGRWTVVGASGTILSSSNLADLTAASWTAASSVGHTQTINCVLYANNLWVTGNAGNVANIRYASDPTGTWTAATGTTNNFSITDIVYLNGFIAVAGNLSYTSTNGTAWSAAVTGSLTGVTTASTNYINLVNNKLIGFYINASLTGSFRPIFISKEGTSWVASPFNQKALSLQDIAYGNNKYVVVGKHTASLGFIGYSTA